MMTTDALSRANEQNDMAFGNPMMQLNEFVGISFPETEAFLPQTWGWWLVFGVIIALVGHFCYRRILHWYRNRYRKQTMNRLKAFQFEYVEGFSLLFLQEIKQAIAVAYGKSTTIEISQLLQPQLAKQSLNITTIAAIEGQALLRLLDLTAEQRCAFNTGLGDAWLNSLLAKKSNQSDALTLQQGLIEQGCIWLMHHSEDLPVNLQSLALERVDA
ncbi:DUF4381 family protein [Shewanella youngdeokensis]|uniref:DUF4381 family protein n=1 Tax=Shewanella youngdeokensis TaxID=2999068 RepID=A0ABZ0K2E2_9GAMM|nr:DUF4381 family protein [Shewanella sp. DAU334]